MNLTDFLQNLHFLPQKNFNSLTSGWHHMKKELTPIETGRVRQ